MSDIIVPLSLAAATFLWYRKGRLWNFYDSLLSEYVKQINENSIDREAWERIAHNKCDQLSEDLFNSLWRFETEYLRNKIIEKGCLREIKLRSSLPLPITCDWPTTSSSFFGLILSANGCIPI